MKWKKLLLIGDSHIQYGYSDDIGGGWLCRLSDYAQRKFDVINRGFSGYNSLNIRTYLPRLIEEFDVESICGIVLIIGTNDAALGKKSITISTWFCCSYSGSRSLLTDCCKVLRIEDTFGRSAPPYAACQC